MWREGLTFKCIILFFIIHSINIAGPVHDEFDSVLFHFNPRQFERGGQLVINDKQTGIWGQAINLPLSQVPLIFGQTSVTLQIQITGEGFDIFIEDKHCARLEHRKELPSEPCSLYLQFPSCDDYGSPENWIVYKTWWGNKPIMAKGDLAGIPGVNSFNAVHPVSVIFQSESLASSTQTHASVLLLVIEKTVHQWLAENSYRIGGRCSPGRVGTGVSEIWWRSRCHLYRSYQYYVCICRNRK